ncbi:hypothetical protein SKAU_G00037900 [Synaphobranchus kaupii]|uniref:Calcium uniporter protein n=1 Tax=Synaphobranchus kaupii TaxID=118154 RepID=A0A9Q1GHJ8_SYNKA|nr:hypothetical protein SKAU_G00037900 [Synaphobranchus kaupii]
MVSLGRVAKLQFGVFQSALSCSSVKANSGYISQIQSRLCLQWSPHRASFCSTRAPPSDITVQYKHGRPVLAIPLPSRRERCLFSLRPMLMNVGDLIQDVRREDAGVTTAAVLSAEGERLSATTSLETVLSKDFQILVNDVTYHVHSAREVMSSEHVTHLEDMKTVVHMLHTALNLPGHHLRQEQELLMKLDGLRQTLLPLEKVKTQVVRKAEHRCSWAMWAGVAVLSLQGGVLAWFTWWVYSWDIMEPITYFLTYATSIGLLSYFILTKQEFVYADAKHRQFLHYFYTVARRDGFDVQKYNKLKEEEAAVKENLRRLRKAIQQRLPVEQIPLKP